MLKDKMALGKSIKMYLTIFIATTCIYMVLYQYHTNRNSLTENEIIKTRQQSKPSSASYVSFLWSPMSILTTRAQADIDNILSDNNADSLTSSVIQMSSSTSLPQVTSSHKSSIISNDKNLSTTVSTTTSTTTKNQKFAKTLIKTTINKSKKVIRQVSSSGLTSLSSSSSLPSSPPSSPTTSSKTTTTKSNQVNKFTQLHHAFDPVSEPPPLYIITPTYRRPEQLAELTRLGYTLKHVVNLLWIVVEDANKTSELVTQTLNRIGVPYEYFVAPMPEEYKKTKKAKPRGVSNRNRGLAYLRANASEGVFYFADDDNTYDISIFEQMRYTKRVSMWPVGLVTKFGVSSPIVRNGKLNGFYDGWIGGRKYPVDMAGFAVSVSFLHERPEAKMPFKPGYEEDGFLRSLAPFDNSDIELLANACTEILTWHTQTKKNPPAQPLNRTIYGDTNIASIDKILVRP